MKHQIRKKYGKNYFAFHVFTKFSSQIFIFISDILQRQNGSIFTVAKRMAKEIPKILQIIGVYLLIIVLLVSSHLKIHIVMKMEISSI